MKTFLLSGEAARRLGVSRTYLYVLADRGLIRTIRASSGFRLFDPDDIEKLATRRQAEHAERAYSGDAR